LRLIQRIRDEAHRFAITFHRDLRSKGALNSKLLAIEGIGDLTANKLLKKFKSYKKIEAATKEEIISVIGKDKGLRVWTAMKKK
jgi:excinuclease ABC subunit C